MNVDLLLEPWETEKIALPTRVVMAPMTRSKSPGNIPGEDVAAYYRRRAENKVGLVITEGTVIHPGGHGYPDVPNFYGDEPLAGWREVVNQVHSAGGKIFPQLWHTGSVRQNGMSPDPALPGYGPSAILHPSLKEGDIPAEMTSENVNEVVDAFAKAAGNARRIGFDGIEIHGAHGYLIDQFFWDKTNHREDSYGGENAWDRIRFAVDIIETSRSAVGANFPICLRFSQWKMGAYKDKLANTPQELEKFLLPLVKAGVDIFHCSTRRFFEPEFSDTGLNLAGWTRKITGKPTITVGSIGLDRDFISFMASGKAAGNSRENIEMLQERLAREEFDLVAIGRALLADPEWITKVAEDRFDEIKVFDSASLASLD